MTADSRYLRHIGLFGAEGQRRLSSTRTAIVGLGGLGAHVAQQLAYLGVKGFVLVDPDAVALSNLNRLIGSTEADLGRPKVEVTGRMVENIQPSARIAMSEQGVSANEPFEGLDDIDAIFGCLDNDVARFELVKLASAFALPLIDLASDVSPEGEFGGRVVFAKDGERCLSCLGELDQHELARSQMSDGQRLADDAIYGVDRDALDAGGPSVVSVNGVVASLAVTEFFVWVTRLREPVGYLNYRGDLGTVGARADTPRTYCYYCMTLWGERKRNAGGA